jgi:hypothetical protein
MTLAAGFLKKGKFTMGQDIELVGLSKRTFRELLALYDTEIISYSPKELKNDIANTKDYSR